MPNMYAIIFLTFCILPSGIARENNREGNNMLYEKPYMSLRIEMTDCYYDIYLNGVAILFDTKGHPLTVNLPVNHWMRSGDNELEVYLYTLSDKPLGDKPECNVTLLGRENGESEELNKEVMKFSYSGRLSIAGTGLENSTDKGKYNSKMNFSKDDKGDVEIHAIDKKPIKDDGGTIFKQIVTLPLNLPLWKFFGSDPLPEKIGQIHDELYPYYEKIYVALKTKNVNSILDMFHERNTELDKAYYNETGTLESKLKSMFNQVVNDSSMNLLELAAKYVAVDLHPNKKIASLARSSGTMPAIVYNFNDESGSQSFDMVFRKSGDKWILTR